MSGGLQSAHRLIKAGPLTEESEYCSIVVPNVAAVFGGPANDCSIVATRVRPIYTGEDEDSDARAEYRHRHVDGGTHVDLSACNEQDTK